MNINPTFRQDEQKDARQNDKRRPSSQKVFVCHNHYDMKYLNKIRRWGKKRKFGEQQHTIVITSTEDTGLRTRTGRLIKPKMERKFKECTFIVILIGQYNEKHPWPRLQRVASKYRKTIYYMRVPYTTSPVPDFLEDVKQIAYNPNAFDKLLESEMEKQEAIRKEERTKARNERSERRQSPMQEFRRNFRSRNSDSNRRPYRPRTDDSNRYRDNDRNRDRDYRND
ncbi:MAG: hypothetical protein ACPG5B_14225 [Chitinophagales bacterium]